MKTLTWTIDGQDTEIVSAIATPDGDQVEIQLTSFPYTCQQWVDGYRDTTYENERTISLILQPNLSPTGELGWAITGTAFQNTTSSAQDGGDPVPGAALDASPGAHSRLDVALDLATLDEPPITAHLEGPIDAIGCGPLTWRGNAVETPPPTLPGVTLKVAGKDVPVGGAALVIGDGGRQLMLASTPVQCIDGTGSVNDHHFLAASDADVELELTWYGAATEPSQANLGGDLLGKGGSTVNWEGGRLTATPSTAKKGAKTVTIALGGKAQLDDYTVELSGEVTATICR
jgi:hypothetical protein